MTLKEDQIRELHQLRDVVLNKLFGLQFFDQAKTDVFIDLLYKIANEQPPIKIYLNSPLEIQLAANLLQKLPDDADPTETIAKIKAKKFPPYKKGQLDYVPFCYRGTWWDLDWVLFYDYFSKPPNNVEVPKIFLEYAEKFLESLPAFLITFKTICLISKPPTAIRRDPQNRLHCAELPAVTFSDHYEQYWVHGIAFTKDEFDKYMIGEPTLSDVMGLDNVEKRTVIMMEHKDMLLKSGAKIVAEDTEYCRNLKKNLPRKLYEFEYERQKLRAVVLVDHSVEKENIHLVPLTCKTPEEAVLWMNHGHKDFITQT